jgi:hypothetical protein
MEKRLEQLELKLNKVIEYLEQDAEQKKNPLKEKWLDIQNTCQLLKISKRTLQTYRDNGIISFSQILGKIYFKASDIDKHLETNYHYQFKSLKNKKFISNKDLSPFT